MTKLHFAVGTNEINTFEEVRNSRYILASYYYVKDLDYNFEKNHEHFILDSGAFSLFSLKPLSKEEMIKYCDDYADYIIKWNITNFVELDVDVIYGYEFVLFLRKRLETKVGRKCIPIWHMSRGIDEFIQMCKDYDYAGIGGIASGEELSKHKDKYKELNKLARKYGCRLHGMGFTPMKHLNSYGFYSVDSTSWKSGSRFGIIYLFRQDRLTQVKKPKGTRLKNYKSLDEHNIKEWKKYQAYCDRN